LRLADNGIWFASAKEPVSYPDEGNDQCFEIEDQSFWFRHRNDCIRELVRNFPPKGKGPIFDVGGGNGFVAKGLMDAGWDVVLLEPGPSGARNAKKRGLEHVVCGTTHSAGFKHGSLPAVGVFDVVEHIEDDLGFLRHLRDLLEPGGMLYLTVPAYNFLWSHEDVDAGHFRRYTCRALSKVLQDAGLQIQFMTSIFAWLLLPVFLFRAIPYRLRGAKATSVAVKSMRSDHSLPAAIAPIAHVSNRWELKMLSRRKTFPAGSSLLCAARKN